MGVMRHMYRQAVRPIPMGQRPAVESRLERESPMAIVEGAYREGLTYTGCSRDGYMNAESVAGTCT